MSRRTVRADCAADPAGALTFDLSLDAAPESVLLLRNRGAAGRLPGGTVRLPLSRSGDGLLRAVLPSTTELPEGRWDAYVEEPGAEDTVTLLPGLRDLRALVDRAPGIGPSGIGSRVPYPTLDGRLAVRCWLRAPHAEAGDVGLDASHLTVQGVLYGVEAGEGAEVEARLPGEPERAHRVPLTSSGGPGGAFAFTLPYAPLTAEPVREEQLWQLWLIPAEGAKGVRISRILDDVWSRKKSFVYPGRPAAKGVVAAPCYTDDNDLCVRLKPVPDGS
ncbi:transferase [Streptomyces sp. cmx-18-6]|uniref:transferase n=1 Tax=Streptomyces sp. cmx-18-6 TaxID=2790930 RepID=UPI00397F3EB9